jgi:hypothetical protein
VDRGVPRQMAGGENLALRDLADEIAVGQEARRAPVFVEHERHVGSLVEEPCERG